jgi:hypothetical protein
VIRRLANALRVVGAAALVVAAGALPVRGINHALDPFSPYPGHTSDYGVARARAIRAVIPEIAARHDEVAIVTGSSGLARAFVPPVFDASLAGIGKKYVSYNLGQLLLQPETALAMAKVVRTEFEGRDRKIGLTLFGISVPELARYSLRAARRSMPEQVYAFESAEEIATRLPKQPLPALRDGLEFAAFGNIRPEQTGLWVEDWLAGKPAACNAGLAHPPSAEYCRELAREFPKGVPPWNVERRGGFDFGLPATRPMLEQMIETQAADPKSQVPKPAVAPPLDLDEDAVSMMVSAARQLAAVSERIFVVRDILNPALVLPEQETAWRAIASRIAHEAGVPLLDLNDGMVAAADFGDRTHLNPLAAERFSAALAARLKPGLIQNHASR